jgi:hypothetical protein
MSKYTFEDFLMEKHAEQYIGTKDCMVDDFEKWLSDLSIDDWLKYGDMLCEARNKELQQIIIEDVPLKYQKRLLDFILKFREEQAILKEKGKDVCGK